MVRFGTVASESPRVNGTKTLLVSQANSSRYVGFRVGEREEGADVVEKYSLSSAKRRRLVQLGATPPLASICLLLLLLRRQAGRQANDAPKSRFVGSAGGTTPAAQVVTRSGRVVCRSKKTAVIFFLG